MSVFFDYESLFPFVSKPSRYIGGEYNASLKTESFRRQALSMCLCFPDLYETGFANMGVEILYKIVNQREDAYCERAYAPDSDLARYLRQNNWPMFSLETRQSLASFDIVGFSLPYELCFNNVLEMLELSQIPIHAAARNESHPLIIGGGPCAVNPEPLCDFFDAFVLGDGEEIIGEIIETMRRAKTQNWPRAKLLLELSQLTGCYVPSLYNVRYHNDGKVAEIAPLHAQVPASVAYRRTNLSLVKDYGQSFPIDPVVPFVQTVHDRLNVEIQRGCPWRCRFCQAGFTYSKYRQRTSAELLEIVERGLDNTGYDAITLAGLSAADHTEIVPLLQTLSARLSSRRISIGLPSTRADRFTLALADLLQTVRRQSLTFAPEAGTERLRRVIRKELQESEIRATLKMAHQHGWKSVKLYFMYGLPTEEQSDLQGIIDVTQASRKENPGLALTVTLSPFVPKPHTPFQWHAQDRLQVHQEKLSFLRKNLKAQIRAHGLEQIALEGVLARGDRRCSALLEQSWRKGAQFDEWNERFSYDLWQKTFAETGLTPEFFGLRQREENEIFPWDHLQGGPEKRVLWNDYQTSLRQANEPPPETPHVKARPQVPLAQPVEITKAQDQVDVSAQRLRLRFARYGDLRFLSHLEQIEMIRRILRRARMPLAYTSGFHPQMKVSFGPAISVGQESLCEYCDVDLIEKLDLDEVKKRLSAVLPRGVELLSLRRVPLFFPSLEAVINRAEYWVYVPQEINPFNNLQEAQNKLQEFCAQEKILFQKMKKTKVGKKLTEIDIKPFILSMEWAQNPNWFAQQNLLHLNLTMGGGQNVKPEKLAGLYLNLPEEKLPYLRVLRQEFSIQKQDQTLSLP